MTRRWVVNASPLILLGKVGHARLLTELTDELIIPKAVAREVAVKSDGARTLEEVGAQPTTRLAEDRAILEMIAAWDLGAGESQVLSVAAAEAGSRAVVDDLDARRCAEALGIPVIGSLGVIFRAKRKGLIPAARPLVTELRSAGLYASDGIVEGALRHLGEE